MCKDLGGKAEGSESEIQGQRISRSCSKEERGTLEQDIRMGRLLGRRGIPAGRGRMEGMLKAEVEEGPSDGGNAWSEDLSRKK